MKKVVRIWGLPAYLLANIGLNNMADSLMTTLSNTHFWKKKKHSLWTNWNWRMTSARLKTTFPNTFWSMHIVVFDSNLIEIFPKDPIDNKPVLVRLMVCRWPGDKLSPEQLIVYFPHVYMHHLTSIRLQRSIKCIPIGPIGNWINSWGVVLYRIDDKQLHELIMAQVTNAYAPWPVSVHQTVST